MFSLPTPGVQTKGAVPLEQGHGHCSEVGTDHDSEPHDDVEGLQEGQHVGLPRPVRVQHGEAGEEVGVGKVNGFLPNPGDAEGGHSEVRRVVDQVLHHPVPRAVLLLPVRLVLHDVQRELKVQVAGQLLQQIDGQAAAALNPVEVAAVAHAALVSVDGPQNLIARLALGCEVEAGRVRQAHAVVRVRRLRHDEGLHGVGDHAVPLPAFRGRLEALGVAGPDDAEGTDLTTLHAAHVLPHVLSPVEHQVPHPEGGDVHEAFLVEPDLARQPVNHSLAQRTATEN